MDAVLPKNKTKILILFPDEWISYSPSILNLIKCIKESNCSEIHLVCFDSGKYKVIRPSQVDNFICIKLNRFVLVLLNIFNLSTLVKSRLMCLALKRKVYDVVIGVDKIGFIAGTHVSNHVNFYSLEVEDSDFFKKLSEEEVRSVAIQSEERYGYLFGSRKHSTFLIPNSPINIEGKEKVRVDYSKTNLICFGNLIEAHGVYIAVEALQDEAVTLTLAGRIPRKEKAYILERYSIYIEQKRLFFEESYIDQSDIVSFLQNYDIGLCFYNFDLIGESNFNYMSSPSGKMYNYFSAGLPVIGNDIVGLNLVRHFSAGILLKNITIDSLSSAILNINSRYNEFSSAAYLAGGKTEFKQASKSYVEFLLSN